MEKITVRVVGWKNRYAGKERDDESSMWFRFPRDGFMYKNIHTKSPTAFKVYVYLLCECCMSGSSVYQVCIKSVATVLHERSNNVTRALHDLLQVGVIIEEGAGALSKEGRKEGRNTKISDSFIQWFDAAYANYPKKKGKQEGLRHLAALDKKGALDRAGFERAVAAYAKERLNEDEKFTKHFSSFCKSGLWKDYAAVEVKPVMDPRMVKLRKAAGMQ